MSTRVGIDLGTANVLVYVKGKGIVINEPSVVALSMRDNSIVAVGHEARDMIGRVPGSISVIRPMREGVIADYTITEAMLRYFIGKVRSFWRFSKPEVMVCVPVGATSVEQRAVRDAAEQAGARRPAYLIPEPLAAAIGAKIPVGSPRGHMVLDIGGGRTEAAVISMYGIVVSESVRVAGDKLDEAIISFVKRRHNLIIGDRMAEEVKIAIGSAIPTDDAKEIEVRGRDQVTGLPRTATVTSAEATHAISDCLAAIVGAAKTVLMKTPPELASDVIDQGIVVTGGGALLRHIDDFVSQETGIPCHIAQDPLRCVAMGAGLALEHLDDIKRNLPIGDELLVSSY
ncbi:MAG: rod shape-determining protein [Dehalococcoidia bacterium]|nr:rod shape-determining protein [Dehalococcoidia bacterium]